MVSGLRASVEFNYRGQTEDMVTMAVQAVVGGAEAETAEPEVAYGDPVTVRSHINATDIHALEEPLACCEVVTDDGIDHHTGCGRLFGVLQQPLLLVPILRGGVRDRG